MSEVQTVSRSYDSPKELQEIFDAVEQLITAAKTPGDMSVKMAAMAGSLPSVIVAIEGFDKVKDEVKHESVYESCGAFGGRVAKTFLKG